MRILIGALAVALLAGCAGPSMQEMRQSGPSHTYSSTKPEDALSKCVLFAWQDTSLAGGNAVAYIQPGRNGGTTVYSGGNEYFVDLKTAGGKTKVDYYEVGNSWISKRLLPKVQSCL